MTEWTIQLCESTFSTRKIFGRAYHAMTGQHAGHSFVRLLGPDGKPVQEVHAGALHVNDDSENDKGWNPLLVLADTALPDKLSRYRIYAWSETGDDCYNAPNLYGRTDFIKASHSDILRRWLSGLEFAARLNSEDRRYHFMDSNCNTASRLILSAMGVSVLKTETSAFGFNNNLRGPTVNPFAAYFNLYASTALPALLEQQRLLTDRIDAGVRPRGHSTDMRFEKA